MAWMPPSASCGRSPIVARAGGQEKTRPRWEEIGPISVRDSEGGFRPGHPLPKAGSGAGSAHSHREGPTEESGRTRAGGAGHRPGGTTVAAGARCALRHREHRTGRRRISPPIRRTGAATEETGKTLAGHRRAPRSAPRPAASARLSAASRGDRRSPDRSRGGGTRRSGRSGGRGGRRPPGNALRHLRRRKVRRRAGRSRAHGGERPCPRCGRRRPPGRASRRREDGRGAGVGARLPLSARAPRPRPPMCGGGARW